MGAQTVAHLAANNGRPREGAAKQTSARFQCPSITMANELERTLMAQWNWAAGV